MEHNYIFRDGDYFEVYLNDYNKHPQQKFIIDICIPIETEDKSLHHSKEQHPKDRDSMGLSSVNWLYERDTNFFS